MTNGFLDTLHSAAQSIRAMARDRFAKLDESQLNWRPQPDAWSVAQCLDHVIVSDRLYYDPLRTAIQNGWHRRIRSNDPARVGRLAAWFIRMVGPDGRRMKHPRIFDPAWGHLTCDVLDDFDHHQKELMELIRRSDGLDLNRIRLHIPVTRLLRFSIGEVLQILISHQRRHINQACRLTERPAFGTTHT